MLPTRFEIDGVRYYRTGDDATKAYPSVTAILGKTAGAKAQQTLAQWNLRNPGAREAAAKRGSIIHAACEAYIRGRPIDVPEELLPYWNGLSKHLDRYDSFLWSEKPLLPKWSFCTGEEGLSRVWSHKHKYCGCPDLVGYRKGAIWLADFKSSVGPYSRYYPKEDNRAQFGGWSKFNKCGIQLGAYAIALEETLDISIDVGQIMVTTPEIDQSFILRGDEMDRFRYKWLQRVGEYYRLIEQERELALVEQEQDRAARLTTMDAPALVAS
jgi:hypothetical protein